MSCLFLGFADVCLSVYIVVVNGILSFNISPTEEKPSAKTQPSVSQAEGVSPKPHLLSNNHAPLPSPLRVVYMLSHMDQRVQAFC